MRRLALTALILLTACATFTPVDNCDGPLCLSYDGVTLRLESDRPVQRGAVGVRAESVDSPYCTPCTPDAEGRVLLELADGPEYGSRLVLGAVQVLERARAAIVQVDANEALETTLEP